MTEVVQIIGRATRDAPGKPVARFTNMIAEPNVSDVDRNEGVNDILKAIGASLLMEQIMAPKIEFLDKATEGGKREGYDYGEDGYQEGRSNVGVPDDPRGSIQIEIDGLGALTPAKKRRINNIANDILPEFISNNGLPFLQMSLDAAHNGTPNTEAMQSNIRKIIQTRNPDLEEDEVEAVRKCVISQFNLTQVGMGYMNDPMEELPMDDPNTPSRSAFAKGIRRWGLTVGDINVDLIEGINPLAKGCNVLSKAFDQSTFEQLMIEIGAFKEKVSHDDVYELVRLAVKFQETKNRLPSQDATDPLERRMGIAIKMMQNNPEKYERYA